jgi:hypothetical protein
MSFVQVNGVRHLWSNMCAKKKKKKSIKWTSQKHAVNTLSGLKWLTIISNNGLLFTTTFNVPGS